MLIPTQNTINSTRTVWWNIALNEKVFMGLNKDVDLTSTLLSEQFLGEIIYSISI